MESIITKVSSQCTTLLSHLASIPSTSKSSKTTTTSNSDTTTSDVTADVSAPTLLDILSDFTQLAQHIGKESTALTLACKAPISVKAVEGTVEKIGELVGKVGVCLGWCEKGGALEKELRWTGSELLEAIQRLLDNSLLFILAPTPKKATQLREVNLRLTGQVWEKVTLATSGLSRSELEATRKDWKNVLGLLDDCLEEVKEMEEEANFPQSEEEEEEEDEDDDDDFRTSHPLTALERSRVTAAHMLLRLSRLLLKRLITSTAPTSSSSSSTAPPSVSLYSSSAFLTLVSPLVQKLSETADDFAAALEPPQLELASTVELLEETGRGISEAIEGLFKVEQEENVEKKETEEGKWQVMWRSQSVKAREKLLSLK